jgi:hypothetical protein
MANIWGRKPIAVLQAEAKEGEFGSVPGEPRLRRRYHLQALSRLVSAASSVLASSF